MGQCATLYRIDKSDFSKIMDNPNDFEPYELAKGYQVFEKSFVALQFILSKGLNNIDQALIEQIFNPKTFIGDQVDFSKIDFGNLTEDIDLDQQAIYYSDPDKIFEIHQLLTKITLAEFQQKFDHHELNELGIYPNNIWNDKTEEDTAFNFRHMKMEFQNLKSIFELAHINGEYLLSYVG